MSGRGLNGIPEETHEKLGRKSTAAARRGKEKGEGREGKATVLNTNF
jgi:hypothetical protein